MFYTLFNYFDVWGNSKDGWEINDQRSVKGNCFIPDDASDKAIAEELVNIGFLTTSDLRRIGIEYEGSIITIYQRKGMKPLGAFFPTY